MTCQWQHTLQLEMGMYACSIDIVVYRLCQGIGKFVIFVQGKQYITFLKTLIENIHISQNMTVFADVYNIHGTST